MPAAVTLSGATVEEQTLRCRSANADADVDADDVSVGRKLSKHFLTAASTLSSQLLWPLLLLLLFALSLSLPLSLSIACNAMQVLWHSA